MDRLRNWEQAKIMAHKTNTETVQVLIRVPLDVKRWLELTAERTLATQNSEILRCIRARMDSEQSKKAVG
jgi:hypothetical protein